MNKIILIFIIFVFLFCMSQNLLADYLSVDTFDDQVRPNNLGGDYGPWVLSWDDSPQSCTIEHDVTEKIDNRGASLKVKYDVDSKRKAACGFFAFLEDADLRKFDKLIFYIKGDIKEGYTQNIMVEISTSNNVSRVRVAGITDKWQKIAIPFSDFREISDWSRVNKFAVVIEDSFVSKKTGVLYFDDIYFSDEERVM